MWLVRECKSSKVHSMLGIIVIFLFACYGQVLAHQPHDVIESIAISPNFNQDQTVFTIMSSNNTGLLKSVNGGVYFDRIVRDIDNRGILKSVTISPGYITDNLVFVASDGDGVYRSQDNGESWVNLGHNMPDKFISLIKCMYDSQSRLILLAAGIKNGLYYSMDLGETWLSVSPSARQIVEITFSPGFSIDNTAYAGDKDGNIYISNDTGLTWNLLYNFDNSGGISSIAVHNSDYFEEEIIYVGTIKRGIYLSKDSGVTFHLVNNGIDDLNISDIVLSPQFEIDQTAFAIALNTAVYKTFDGGKNWQVFDKGIRRNKQSHGLSYRYLCISDEFADNQTIFMGAFEGLFRSTNAGKAWVEAELHKSMSISGIAFSPANPFDGTIAISCYGSGVSKTTDYGSTWFVKNIGVENPFMYDIAMSPDFDTDQVLFGLQQFMVLRSDDGGDHWVGHEVDPGEKLYPTKLGISHNFANDKTLFVGTRYHGLYRSIDGGFTWQKVKREKDTIISIQLSPNYANDHTILISSQDTGVFRSTDGGDTWVSANDGLTSLTSDHVLMSPLFDTDNTAFVTTYHGLFKSSDGGISWYKASSDPLVSDTLLEYILLSPNFNVDATMYASIRGLGLAKSIDDAQTWSLVGTEIIDSQEQVRLMHTVPVSPTDYNIYVTTDAQIYVSDDYAQTWLKVNRDIVRYENYNQSIYFSGKWDSLHHPELSASSAQVSNERFSFSYLTFTGTSITWIGIKGPAMGKAKVYLDGLLHGDVDLYSPTWSFLVPVYTINDLAPASHTLRVVVKDTKNVDSSDTNVVVDAFDVVPLP